MEIKNTGKLIANLRKSKNLDQGELAIKIGVTDKAVSKWETGNGLPDIQQILSLSKFFGVSVDDLLNGEISSLSKNNQMSTLERASLEGPESLESLKNAGVDIFKHDEFGNHLLDYIFKHNLIRVYDFLVENEFIKPIYLSHLFNSIDQPDFACNLFKSIYRSDLLLKFEFNFKYNLKKDIKNEGIIQGKILHFLTSNNRKVNIQDVFYFQPINLIEINSTIHNFFRNRGFDAFPSISLNNRLIHIKDFEISTKSFADDSDLIPTEWFNNSKFLESIFYNAINNHDSNLILKITPFIIKNNDSVINNKELFIGNFKDPEKAQFVFSSDTFFGLGSKFVNLNPVYNYQNYYVYSFGHFIQLSDEQFIELISFGSEKLIKPLLPYLKGLKSSNEQINLNSIASNSLVITTISKYKQNWLFKYFESSKLTKEQVDLINHTSDSNSVAKINLELVSFNNLLVTNNISHFKQKIENEVLGKFNYSLELKALINGQNKIEIVELKKILSFFVENEHLLNVNGKDFENFLLTHSDYNLEGLLSSLMGLIQRSPAYKIKNALFNRNWRQNQSLYNENRSEYFKIFLRTFIDFDQFLPHYEALMDLNLILDESKLNFIEFLVPLLPDWQKDLLLNNYKSGNLKVIKALINAGSCFLISGHSNPPSRNSYEPLTYSEKYRDLTKTNLTKLSLVNI